MPLTNLGVKLVLHRYYLGSHFLTRNALLHRCSKHIDVYYYSIREKYEEGHFELKFVSGKENPAEQLTKALQGDNLSYLCSHFLS